MYKNIKDLLYNNECVVVPGLGAFVTNYHESVVQDMSSEKVLLSPPFKSVSFNSTITSSDGLLIGFVAQSEKIDYQNAKIKVETFVSDVFYKLQKKEIVYFQNIGELRYDENNKILFEPKKEINFLLDSYGLQNISTDIVVAENHQNKSPKYLKIGLKSGAIAAAFAGLFVVASQFNWFESQNNAVIHSTDLNPIHNKTKKAKLTPIVGTLTNAIHFPNYSVGVTTIQEDVSLQTPNNKYYVIAGSFADKQNALVLKNTLVQNGHAKAEIIELESKYRVCYQGFATKQEAVDYANNINRSSKNQVWVLKVEK